jgi:hypothetical protein
VVNFSPQPVYFCDITSLPIGGLLPPGMGWGVFEEDENFLPLLVFEPNIAQPVA